MKAKTLRKQGHNMSVYEDAVNVFGKNHQKQKLIEELAELLAALTNEKQDENSICEELADVQIMLTQAKYIFNGEKVIKFLTKKENRLRKLINIKAKNIKMHFKKWNDINKKDKICQNKKKK